MFVLHGGGLKGLPGKFICRIRDNSSIIHFRRIGLTFSSNPDNLMIFPASVRALDSSLRASWSLRLKGRASANILFMGVKESVKDDLKCPVFR